MIIKQKSDVLGAISSSLCLIHCVFTPVLFVAQTQVHACCKAVPNWWGSIDYFFLAISFIAIHQSVKTTAKNWMKYALWINWLLLFFIIVNEHMGWLPLIEESIYIPSLSLVFLHLYNRKYCQCSHNKCCTNQ